MIQKKTEESLANYLTPGLSSVFIGALMVFVSTLVYSQAYSETLPEKCRLVKPDTITTAKAMIEASTEDYVISKILLVKQLIFDSQDSEENQKIHQLANRFHRVTSDKVILRQLPFKVGDPYQQQSINEAERTLRANPYWSEVRIEPHLICGQSLILKVVAKEVWTIIPGASYSNVDGDSTVNVSVTDVNFLGAGQSLSLGYTNDNGQDAFRSSFFAPYLVADSIDLFASVATGDSFESKSLRLTKPFRDYDTQNAFGIEARTSDFDQSRYLRTQAFYSYDLSVDRFNIFWGTSSGLEGGWVKRLRMGITRDLRNFSNQRNLLSEGGPILDRERLTPWLSYSRFSNQFSKATNIRHMHRTEDIFHGISWSVRMGYANDEQFNVTDFVSLNTIIRGTPLFTTKHLLQTQFSFDANWATAINQGENTFITAQARYYWLHSSKQRTYFFAQRTLGRSLTVDRLLTQGGNQGLRGYPEFYQLGNERYRINLEHRYYANWELWRLFQFAGVIYADAGRSWFSEPTFGISQYDGDEMLWNLGVGLRIASNRTGLGSIAHIDLAFPMTNPPQLASNQLGEGFDDWRFTIELKSGF